jgi:hypothetical protein
MLLPSIMADLTGGFTSAKKKKVFLGSEKI